MNSSLHAKRLRAEARFRRYGQAALAFALLMLAVLFASLFWRGVSGFTQTQIQLPIDFTLDDQQSPSAYHALWQQSLSAQFPDMAATDKRALFALISQGAGLELKRMASDKPGTAWLTAASDVDLFFKGEISEDMPESERRLSDAQIGVLKTLDAAGQIRTVFNRGFFTGGDSRTPERAGFWGAMVGSALTLLVCLAIAFPLGVMTAVYLEEFAPKNRFTDLIEVNINNLAAVPSIVFGLLGLAVYINVMGLPRSSALVGGMTLALMILPVIIIATRASLSAVPDSIRDAARALGASALQVVWHHTLPLAMPGVMTGTILGLSRAIGETAPLIMIGMVAFVADIPSGFSSPATVMPVQVYLWASSPEAGFVGKTAAGILVLLALLLVMNALAVYIRKRFETRW